MPQSLTGDDLLILNGIIAKHLEFSQEVNRCEQCNRPVKEIKEAGDEIVEEAKRLKAIYFPGQ